tara:strand:- start:34963 stop:35235 length:273 start_codon:yes stop_codon:yes gene_type:complete
MLTQITDRIPPLPILLPVLLIAWAAACTWLHGPAILAYVVLQGATSGIFALSMYRVTKKHCRIPAEPQGKLSSGDSPTSVEKNKQPVAAQ